MTPRRRYALGGLSGLLAAAAALGVGELVAAVTGAGSPVVVVGELAINLAPAAAKDYAVRTLGTADKPVLVGGVVLVVLAVATVAGVIGVRRRRTALAIATGLGLLALAAAVLGRAGQPWFVAALPPVAAAMVSVGALALLLRRLTPGVGSRDDTRGDGPLGFDRRSFLQAALAVGAVAAVTPVAARQLVGGGGLREAVRLPAAGEPAALPAGAALRVAGISPFVTPNADFYRVDTLLTVPRIAADTWRLRVHGLVERELDINFRDLLNRRVVERFVTLTCVSNEVGGPYLGTARWLGIPIADLLAEAGVAPSADAVKSTSADGFTVGTPLSALTDGRDALLAIGMNGEPLPYEHGFPVRMVVPGLYGYVSATKWLVDLEVSRFTDFDAYWTTRGWAAEAPIKTSSRIDVPRPFARVAAGPVTVAGVAWAQHRGVRRVEVRVDDGDWSEAGLGEAPSADTWRQWRWTWDAEPGQHRLEVRATDDEGVAQVQERRPPRPDGSTGWHNVVVTVT